MTRAVRRIALVSTASVTALLAAACTHTTKATPQTPLPMDLPSTAATAPRSATDALTAYRAMWADVVAVSTDADYQSPRLSDHLGGAALRAVTENLAYEKTHGIIALGNVALHPVAVTTSPTSVVLADCVDDTGWLNYDAATRTPVDASPGGYRATSATVQLVGGAWKVTQINSGADGTCHPTR